VAVAAAEQCGRTRVPEVASALPLTQALQKLSGAPGAAQAQRWLLSPAEQAWPMARRVADLPAQGVLIFSGPEGGFTDAEERLVLEAGGLPTRLGPRILRAETAPLAVLATLAQWDPQPPG